MLQRISLLALCVLGFARVAFVAPAGEGPVININVTCGTNTTFSFANYFTQTCVANNCVAPVSFTWAPDLSAQGVTWAPPSLVINPTVAAAAAGSISTVITASDNDGPSANGTFMLNFKCPLTFANTIADQTATEGTMFTLDVASYFYNPSRNVLTWQVQGLPQGTSLAISSSGVLSGFVGAAEAVRSQPIPLTIVATDTKTGASVRSNTFNLRVTQKTGLTFPSSLGNIPDYTATENVLAQIAAARYFSNPSNFLVTWSISGGLSIDSTTGTISVTPGQAELLATRVQPLLLTVSGVDERGNLATSNTFRFTVQPQKLAILPIVGSLPSLTCGSFCCSWNPADYVSNPSSNAAQFTLVGGLLSSSQIKMNSNGTMTGVASMVDVRASPITLIVTVNNGQAAPTPMPAFTFSVTALPSVSVSSQPLPTRTVKVNTFFQLDTAPYFVIPTGSVANYSISSSSTSLSVDFTGKVSGTITDADYSNNRFLIFTVTADNKGTCGGGAVSQTFNFTLDPNWQGPSCSGKGNPPDITICENSNFGTRSFQQYCSDPKGTALTYSITGINATGLIFNTATGSLSGTVSQTATDLGAVSVSVCAMNIYALQDCTAPFTITFKRAKRPPIVDPPIPSPVTAILGQRFVGYFNFHFYEPDWQPLIYSVAGLPVGSGMGIGPITGIFSGTPNTADLRASPLILSVFASNEQNVAPNDVCSGQGRGGRARADLIIIIEQQHAPPNCRPIPQDNSVAQLGMFWARDVSPFFQSPDGGKIEYALRSLPRGSGLTVDPRSGVVSGVLSNQDLAASPLSIVVAATNGYGMCQSIFQLNINTRPIGPPPSPLPSARPCPINVRNIFMQSVNPGVPANIDLSKFFTATQNLQLSYTSVGMPRGTGFTQNSFSGLFSGVASSSDLAQGSMTIFTTVSCGNAGQPVSSQWQLVVSQSQCNACQNNNGGCQQQCTVQNPQVCQPTCGCNMGFVLNTDGRTCRPTNPCEVNNGGCSGVCTPQGQTASCGCSQNWALNSDRQTCQYDPCGSNNGGCEQLCTPNGNQPRCSCRVGMLNQDGRTCGSQVITVGTIPPALVLGCQNFMFDVSTAFRSANGSPLTYKLMGLPSQSGFSITSAGMMSGTPTQADCNSAQPMTVTIYVSDGKATVSAVMFLSTFCNSQTCGNNVPQISGGATSIPVLWPQVCSKLSFDITPYFNNQPNLMYSVLGLPLGSGLSMNPTGILGGSPAFADCATQSPLTVVARDMSGRELKAILTLKYQSCDCSPNQYSNQYGGSSFQTSSLSTLSTGISFPIQTSISVGIPSFSAQIPTYTTSTSKSSTCSVGHIHRSAQCGTAFFYDTSDNFRVTNLRYTISGLPAGTGFSIGSSGVISGTANAADARSIQPLVVTVTATDQTGSSCDLTLNVYVEPSCQSYPTSTPAIDRQYRSAFAASPPDAYTGILPIQIARPNQKFFLNMSTIAFSAIGQGARYELEGLPKNNGVSMDAAGVISGTPLDAACQFKPTNLTVRARKGDQVAEVSLFIYFVCSDEVVRPFDLNGGTLPSTTATIGELFYYDAAPFLTGSNLTAATFEVVGLASGSSLHMSPNGVLLGFPASVDVNGPPLLVMVRDDSGRKAQATLRLQVLNGTANATSERDPICIPIQRQVATEGVPFLMGVASRFADQAGGALFYSLTGLPTGSGLTMDRVSGLISGTPTSFDADAQPQPLVLTVTASTEQGKSCAQMFLLTVAHGSEKMNHNPAAKDLPRIQAKTGEQLILPLSSYFADPDGDRLTYSASGLQGSGLSFNTAVGVLYGKPSNSAPLTLTVGASDGKGGSTSSILQLSFSDAALPTPAKPAQVFDAARKLVEFRIQTLGAFSAAQLSSTNKTIKFEVSGLPKGTGLAIDSTSGVLSGSPTLQDVLAADFGRLLPITIRLTESAKKVTDVPLKLKLSSQYEENNAPIAQSIPSVAAFPGQRISTAIWPSFADVDGGNLTFSVVGLPENSGFLMLSSGIFVGTASPADFAITQPMLLTVIARNGRGAQTQEMMSLLVSESKADVPKSCGELGWPVSSPTGCARSVKISGGCPHQVTFQEAQNMCKLAGARLCSTQELSESRYASEENECDVQKERVWTSSWCADGSVMTQAGSDQSMPKNCLFKQEKAMVKCCADRAVTSADVAAVSEKTCEQLPSFVTPASSTNKAVCSTTSVVAGAKGSKCSGSVTFAKAKDICARQGARLCTTEELAQDSGSDKTCGYADSRVWTSSKCAQEGQVMTQAGASLFLGAIPKQCSPVTEELPVYCCADQRANQYFRNLSVNATTNSITLDWDWKLYPRAQVSYQKASGSKGEHAAIARVKKQVAMGGAVSIRLADLEADTRYAIRISPLNEARKIVEAQAVEFRASTLGN